jgi:hypothetical protein
MKSVVYKFLYIVVFVLALNYIYKAFFWEKDIQKHSPIINQVRKLTTDSAEVVYFGESSNTTFREDDKDKRPISNMIADYYPGIKFGLVQKEATHAGNYLVLLKNIPARSTVKTVIITMNLRSFDASWIYSELETPLQKSMVLLQPRPALLNRIMLSFKGYDHKTVNERKLQYMMAWRTETLKFPFAFKYQNVIEWDRGLAKEGLIKNDGSRNEEATILACHYVKTYAFQIDTNKNPRIRDFDAIAELCHKRQWTLIFNLMAENVEKANELVGQELVFLIRQNHDLLVKRYSRRGVIVVDNLDNVPDEQYIDRTWTTEHYAEEGRKLIARNVADSLRKIYPSQYVRISPDK